MDRLRPSRSRFHSHRASIATHENHDAPAPFRPVSIPQPSSIDRDETDRGGGVIQGESRFHSHRASIATPLPTGSSEPSRTRGLDSTAIEHRSRRPRHGRCTSASGSCLDSTAIEHRSRRTRRRTLPGRLRDVSIPQPSSIDRDVRVERDSHHAFVQVSIPQPSSINRDVSYPAGPPQYDQWSRFHRHRASIATSYARQRWVQVVSSRFHSHRASIATANVFA